ncbi:MAG: hypothetical protein AAF337_06210 [Pseudomonadota bacterium]
MTHRLILGLLLLALAGCASSGMSSNGRPDPGDDYSGADAGTLVYAVGTVRGFGMRFAFPYSRTQALSGETVDDWQGRIRPSVGGAVYLKILNPDFEGFETGHLVTRALPPGRYNIRDFEFFGSGPAGSYGWSSAVPFSIAFTIEPGKATYIGSFMRSLAPPGDTGKIGAAGYFIVANRAARDLLIARERLPSDTVVMEQVTDVDRFGSAVLRSRSLEPADAVP